MTVEKTFSVPPACNGNTGGPADRLAPPEWQALLEYARAAAPAASNGAVGWQRALRVHNEAADLPVAALKRTAYYGMGKIMHGMARELRCPESLRSIRQALAENMLRGAIRRRSLPPYAAYRPTTDDLAAPTAWQTFLPAAERAWQALPAPERCVADVATQLLVLRRLPASRDVRSLQDGTLRLDLKSWWSMRQGYRRRPSVRHVASNALVGAGSVIARLHRKEWGERPGRVIDMAILDSPDYARALTLSTRLRGDELQSAIGWGWDESDSWGFSAAALRTPSPPSCPTGRQAAAEGRLGCPARKFAMFVGGSVLPPAIGMAWQLTPAAVGRRN